MKKICFKLHINIFVITSITYSYFRRLSPRELMQKEEILSLQPCPDCASKPFLE